MTTSPTSDASNPKPKRARKPRRRKQPRQGLTAKEIAFCEAYVLQKNGAAAVAATWEHTRRWKPQTRAEKAARLLARGNIAARVAELALIAKEKAKAAFAMSAEECITRLTAIARGSLRNFVTVDALGRPVISLKGASDGALYALSEVTVEDIDTGRRRGTRTKVKLGDRIAALRLLGMHHQLFAERVEHQHEHRHVIEHAAAELDNRLALLTARRVDEVRQTAEDADAVPVPAEAA